MNTSKENAEAVIEEVKSCFEELGLPFSEGEKNQHQSILETSIDEGSFCIDVEVVVHHEDRTIGISVTFSKTLIEDYRCDLQRVINYINCYLMDIGHFAIAPENMDIYFVASIHLYGDESRREQIFKTMQRVIVQGLETFIILLRMLVSSPATVMEELIQERVEKRKTEASELH